MELTLIQQIAIFALPVIFAITLHEASHGYAAKYFGDATAYLQGRVSVNPIRHIDPVGTILVPMLILIASKFLGGGAILFGWAKPVPVNFGNLRRPKRDMLWVAAAGPGSNFLMALFWGAMIKIGLAFPGTFFGLPLALMGTAGILINVILMVLNLLPLPPLDGGRIAVSLLPNRLAYRFAQIEPFGLMILLVLLFTGILGAIMWPLISLMLTFIAWVFAMQGGELIGLLATILQ